MSKRTYEQITESATQCTGAAAKAKHPSHRQGSGRSPSTISREIHRNAGGMATPAGLPISAAASGAFTAAPCQAAPPGGFVPPRVRPSAPALVAPANCRSPQKTPPPRQAPASVTREHLHLHLCPAPGRAQEVIGGLSAHGSRQALAPLQRQGPAWGNPGRASIHVRPPEIEDRRLPGHWEGDLIKGANNAAPLAPWSSAQRLVLLVKLPHPNPATAAHVLQAFSDSSMALPARCARA